MPKFPSPPPVDASPPADEISPPPVDRGYPWRIGGIAVATAIIYGGVADVIARDPVAASIEGGPLENLQVVLALLAAMMFAVAAWRTRFGTAALTVCAAAMAYAAARESDALFETYLFDDAYKYLVGLPAAAAVALVAWRRRQTLVTETLAMCRHPAATSAAIAAVYLLFVCQTFDRPMVWDAAGESKAAIKPVVEETAEVFAYLVIAYSAVESMMMARQSRRGMRGAAGHTGETISRDAPVRGRKRAA